MLDRRCGRLAEAASAFRRAAADSGSVWAQARLNLANIELWNANPTAAAQEYEALLDVPEARFEARYNLAVALSRLHRFSEADAHLEEAAQLDLARMRSAGRIGDPRMTTDVMDGAVGCRELWRMDAGSVPPAAHAPRALRALLPGGRISAVPPTLIFAIFLGLLTGRLLRRRLSVQACHHCGAPVCRRCVNRTAGHAYCAACSASLGGLRTDEYGRLLLKRLLGREVPRIDRVRAWAGYALPGLGLVTRGRPLAGLIHLWFFAFGVLLATRAVWIVPPSPYGASADGLLRLAGLLIAIAAAATSTITIRRLGRHRSLKRFFEPQVDRFAA